MNVALVTYSEQPDLSDSDVLLVEPLSKLHIKAKGVPWDDNTIDWKQFDLVVLRSCWNYHYNIEKFLSWLEKLEKNNVKVLNSPSIVKWNLNKKYLLDLQKKQIPIIPTIIVDKQNISNIDSLVPNSWSSTVIKPTIGASAFEIMRMERNKLKESITEINTKISGNEFIVQPLMKEISQGEYSFIYIGNILGHVILKIPMSGDYRTNYKYGGKEILVQPTQELVKQVGDIMQKVNLPTLYTRVDGIVVDGIFSVMELELIEPYLFLKEHPSTAELFAKHIGTYIRDLIF